MPKCTGVFKLESCAVVFCAAPGGTAVNREHVGGQADCRFTPCLPTSDALRLGLSLGLRISPGPWTMNFPFAFLLHLSLGQFKPKLLQEAFLDSSTKLKILFFYTIHFQCPVAVSSLFHYTSTLYGSLFWRSWYRWIPCLPVRLQTS